MSSSDESSELFVRKASGLVRVATSSRVFMFNIFWTAFGFVMTYVFFWGAVTSPGADLAMGALISTIFVLPQVLLYAFFSFIFPRSGGDYHYVGRSLHPSLGFMVSFAWVVWLSFWAAWGSYAFVGFGLAPIVTTWGAIIHSSALINLGAFLQTTQAAWIIGGIVLVLAFIISVVGTEKYFKLQSFAFALLILGILGFLGLLAVSSQGVFVDSFNNALNWITGNDNTYQYVLNKAAQLGVDLSPGFSLMSLLILIPLYYTYMPYCIGSTFMAGEIKNIKKAQIWGGPVATIFLGLFSALLAYLFVSTIGAQFWYAVGNLWWLGEYDLIVPPYLPSFVGLLTNNFLIYAIISLGYLIWGVWFVPQNIMLNSRIMLAWSFDKVAPEFMSNVSERFRTPIINSFIIFVLAEIFLALYLNVEWLTLVSSIFALAIIALLTGLGGIVFPYVRRHIFESSPANWRLGGIPVLTILGALDVLVILFLSYLYMTVDTLAANAPESLMMISGIFIAGFILYWIAYLYRKSQGIDISLAFKEIPPE